MQSRVLETAKQQKLMAREYQKASLLISGVMEVISEKHNSFIQGRILDGQS